MALTVFTSQSTASPDPQTPGSNPIAGVVSGGHPGNLFVASADSPDISLIVNNTFLQSAIWTTFGFNLANVTAINLIFDYTATGTTLANPSFDGSGQAVATVSYLVQYSPNDGGTWLNILGQDNDFSVQGTSITPIPPSQSVANIRVRELNEVSAVAQGGQQVDANSEATLISTMNNLRIEVTTSDGGGGNGGGGGPGPSGQMFNVIFVS